MLHGPTRQKAAASSQHTSAAPGRTCGVVSTASASVAPGLYESSPQASASIRDTPETEPCGRALCFGAAKLSHLKSCSICTTAAARHRSGDVAAFPNFAGKGEDVVLVVERLIKILHSSGDVEEPLRECARVALRHVLQWQRVLLSGEPSCVTRHGSLSLQALRTRFPTEWAQFSAVEHGRSADAAADAEADTAVVLSIHTPPLVTTPTALDAASSSSSAPTADLGPHLTATCQAKESRLSFADERSVLMTLEEYEAYASSRTSSLAFVPFIRLSAFNLIDFVSDWLGYDVKPGRQDLPAKRAESIQALCFFCKLSLLQVAELVECANRRAHGGVLRQPSAALPVTAYEAAALQLSLSFTASLSMRASAPADAELPAGGPTSHKRQYNHNKTLALVPADAGLQSGGSTLHKRQYNHKKRKGPSNTIDERSLAAAERGNQERWRDSAKLG
eukprot:CAMPEP_0115869300 /NCGR_PEP_ID=MMETSP0287-20121206/21739_1 /TAXON_ID=412157 /ORGANISM="Chrysochromulina rotalis, Strain UIO044" /LENGTH=448 /DNA_ID=CAMNT_0003323985 /DNA_START=72 /DNA_END=1418 /DNA_ORIENTATION=-